MTASTSGFCKFVPKDADEIKGCLNGGEGLWVLWCRKCFLEYREEETGWGELRDVLEEAGIEIIGEEGIPFLCNRVMAPPRIRDAVPEGGCTVGVYSCGIGIQRVAGLLEGRKVVALADSVSHARNAAAMGASHGISLDGRFCAGCGQCYLSMTGGVCPVVDCAKGLLNGPCGGARDGMCEVIPEKECAWLKIYERIGESAGGAEVRVHDHARFSVKERLEVAALNDARRREGFDGGVYPREDKEELAGRRIARLDTPPEVWVFLSQHTGVPAVPLVKQGQRVLKGQPVGEPSGRVSAFVHASVSGEVVGVEERVHPLTGSLQPAVVIAADGGDDWYELSPVEDWQGCAAERLVDAVYRAGVVGLGGAMFPSHVKFAPPRPVDTLLVNGCECEPMLAADDRLMQEEPKRIVAGAGIVKRMLGVKNVVIVVEDNKPRALEVLSRAVEDFLDEMVVMPVATKYPQGAERLLIKRVLGREVPAGGLPFDAGVVVGNVATMCAVHDAVVEGRPLVERVVSVGGNAPGKHGNYMVPVGTPLGYLLGELFPSVDELDAYDVLFGGPMMGVLQYRTDTATVKGTNSVLLLEKEAVRFDESRACIRCGRCVDACPMGLYPMEFVFYGERGEWDRVSDMLGSCIECGCCRYVCSSRIDILYWIKKGKSHVRDSA